MNLLVVVLVVVLVGLPLLLGCGAVAGLAALTLLGSNLETKFEAIADEVEAAP